MEEATSAVVIAEVAAAAGEASETAVVAVVVGSAEEAVVVGLRSPSQVKTSLVGGCCCPSFLESVARWHSNWGLPATVPQ